MVHFYRNVFSHVPSTRVREVSHMLKAIHAQESHEAANNKALAIVNDLRASKMSKAADLVEQAVHETLTYYGFPDIQLDQRFFVYAAFFQVSIARWRATASQARSPRSDWNATTF
jgi:hypothetical protein